MDGVEQRFQRRLLKFLHEFYEDETGFEPAVDIGARASDSGVAFQIDLRRFQSPELGIRIEATIRAGR